MANSDRGGLYGPAAATALEDLPYDARGILSGLYQVCGFDTIFMWQQLSLRRLTPDQQGYAVGYMLAAVFYRALVPTTSQGWRSLFW